MPIVIGLSQTGQVPPQPSLTEGFATAGADYSQPFESQGAIIGEAIWFETKTGEEINLSTVIDKQYKAGISGRWAANVEHFSEAVPGGDGERYRGTRVLPNQIVVPITLVADSITELRARVRALATSLNPKRGTGKLHVVTLDGLHRYANCILESFPTDDPATSGELYDAALDLTFRAFDPFWYDQEYTPRQWKNTSLDGTFFPIFPVRVGTSGIFGNYTETNEGDTEAWPVWVVQGPGENFRFENETTGQYTEFYISLQPNQQLVIDTRIGVKRVYLASDPSTSLFPFFLGSLWPLQPGDNQVTVKMAETNAATQIDFGYRSGFIGV